MNGRHCARLIGGAIQESPLPGLTHLKAMIQLKSIYAESEPGDGTRILVMRVWPRGVRKDRVDEWLRDLSPSRELMRALRSQDIRPDDFFEGYRREMAGRSELLKEMAERAKTEILTLLCWERRDEDCHRRVLKDLIEMAGSPGDPRGPGRPGAGKPSKSRKRRPT